MQSEYNELWWAIEGTLAGMAMPFIAFDRRYNHGGALTAYNDDLPLLYGAGIRAVVSLLNIPTDKPVFETAGFDFGCFPIMDGAPPTTEDAIQIAQFIDQCRATARPVAVFCEAGLGRTGTVIAIYLIQSGMTATEAIRHVRSREPAAIETMPQLKFLEEFARRYDRLP